LRGYGKHRLNNKCERRKLQTFVTYVVISPGDLDPCLLAGPEVCNGRGRCQMSSDGFECVCDQGYEGNQITILN